LQYSEDIGWYKVPNLVSVPAPNVSTADQAIGASVTNYITNSDLHVSAGRPLRVGTVMRWHICFAKTAAGTVSMTFDMRGGTLGTTGDASRANLATGTQTAVADNGELEVACTVRSISATGTVNTSMQLEHNFAATGLAPPSIRLRLP
jgi:CCR4-NOT transcriptional regulation complex NOT5 subunit